MQIKDLQRFTSLYDTDKLTGCWIWRRGFKGLERALYSSFSYRSKNVLGHRFIYIAMHGDILPGYQVDHLCNNTRCVNPFHLATVTPEANRARSNAVQVLNARKTHCKHGHELTNQNTYINPRGERQCRLCGNQSCQRWYEKSASAASISS